LVVLLDLLAFLVGLPDIHLGIQSLLVHRDRLDLLVHRDLPEFLVFLVFPAWLVALLDLSVFLVVLQDKHQGILGLQVNLVCLLFLAQLVVLLDLWALSVVLRDTHLGIQDLLVHRDLLGLLDHRDLPGFPVVLGNLVFLTDRKLCWFVMTFTFILERF